MAGSSATAGTLENLPSFRLQSRENRANAFEAVYFRVFFRREAAGAGLGREFVHPADVVLWERKRKDDAGHARRQLFVRVKDAQPDFRFRLSCERCSLHGDYTIADWGSSSRE